MTFSTESSDVDGASPTSVPERPLILLTNDDGIDSDGLLSLKSALDQIADVWVVAPDRDWSIIGHAKTMRRPLQVEHLTLADGHVAHVVDGTPVDCVSLGILGLLPRRPDIIVSGANKGPNLGEDIIYSGTVAAAIEGLIHGVPSIAISQAAREDFDFSSTAVFARVVVGAVLGRGLPKDVLLNVNVPNLPPDKIGGVAVTQLSRRVYKDVLERHREPNGASYYVINGDYPRSVPCEGTDADAVDAGWISVTPIHIDLTSYVELPTLRNWELGCQWTEARTVLKRNGSSRCCDE